MIKTLTILIAVIFSISTLYAQEDGLISIYEGSELEFDDDLGFETMYYLTGPTSHTSIDGKINRRFCSAPENVSAYEIIKNYEKAILSKGGEIIYLSREASSYTHPETGSWVRFMRDYFTNGRLKPTSRSYVYMQLVNMAEDYVVGKITTDEFDYYIAVAAASIEESVYYDIVITKAEPLDVSKVTLNIMDNGMEKDGKVAVYDIYFDTGSAVIKAESSDALTVIANYLKAHADHKYLVVGHTDNEGDFDQNLTLSKDRANAVINKLVADYGVAKEQLKAFGASSASPVKSNESDKGRAKNRRVEFVLL